jgi:hypothetical protein
MTTQNYKNGERVFCFSQSLLGGGSRIYGTVKVCAKYTWVILDDGERYGKRVRIDRANWYTEEKYERESKEYHLKYLQYQKDLEIKEKRDEEKRENLINQAKEIIPSVGKLVKKYIKEKKCFWIYKITDICEDGILFLGYITDETGTKYGYEDDETIVVGKINEAYYEV